VEVRQAMLEIGTSFNRRSTYFKSLVVAYTVDDYDLHMDHAGVSVGKYCWRFKALFRATDS
jgi:hypothetical protein